MIKFRHALFAGFCASAFVLSASGQSKQPAVFVAHNGNFEGSVASLTINPDNTLNMVDFVVTGDNSSGFDAGTNAYSISLSPSGEFLAVGHAAGTPPWPEPDTRRITILRVHADATLSIHGHFRVPRTPMGVQWLDDSHLAVTEIGTVSRVWVYYFDWETNELLPIDFKTSGNFTTSLAISPDRSFLYANNSSGNTITVFEINPNRTLTSVQVQGTGGTYPMGMGMAPNGKWIYAGGGISSGGNRISGFAIDENDGTLTVIPDSPFVSPGASPKQVVVNADSTIAIAGHGTDSTVRTFSITPESGRLISTGHMFDVGAQGTLGDLAMLGDLLFVPDRSTIFDGIRGLYCFTVNADGSLTQNGPIVDTLGIEPYAVAVWPAALCPADLSGDGVVNVGDLLSLLADWGPCPAPCASDLTGDGNVGVADMLELLAAWGSCP